MAPEMSSGYASFCGWCDLTGGFGQDIDTPVLELSTVLTKVPEGAPCTLCSSLIDSTYCAQCGLGPLPLSFYHQSSALYISAVPVVVPNIRTSHRCGPPPQRFSGKCSPLSVQVSGRQTPSGGTRLSHFGGICRGGSAESFN